MPEINPLKKEKIPEDFTKKENGQYGSLQLIIAFGTGFFLGIIFILLIAVIIKTLIK